MAKMNIPQSGLAMTAEHHRMIGSTPSQVLVDNPGKTWLETMSQDQLLDHLRRSVAVVEESYDEAISGSEREARLLEIVRDDFLVPDFDYLREIDRLPAEFQNLDPRTKFAFDKEG